MGNLATPTGNVKVHFKTGARKHLIYGYKITMDTAASDLTIHTPQAGYHCAVLGLVFQDKEAMSITFKSGTTTLVTLEVAANSAPIIQRIDKKPILLTEKAEALIINCATAPITTALIYVAELARLDFLE